MLPNPRIVIQNGLFSGRAEVNLSEAIAWIAKGLAAPVNPVWHEVNGCPDYTFTEIRMTYKEYDQIVNATKAPVKAHKERQYAAFEPPVCIPALQREEVYQGSRQQGTAGPTKTLCCLRQARLTPVTSASGPQARSVEFIDWKESDTFPRKRYNEQRIPTPTFRSESEMRARLTRE
jgi:hypothetical protein